MVPYVEFDYNWEEVGGENPAEMLSPKRLNQKAAKREYNRLSQWANAHGIIIPEYFMHPERYFWADDKYLILLGTNLFFQLGVIDRDGEETRYPHELTEAEKCTVDKIYGENHSFGRPSETLSVIYNYLAYTKTTPYYKALMEFKWRTGLLSFPLFDVRERIINIDGKLVGYVWDRKQAGILGGF